MYCIQCGVRLADTEKVCPLCRTQVPVVNPVQAEPLYPANCRRPRQMNRHTAQFVLLAAFLLAFVICLLCDLQPDGRIGWSGFVMTALPVVYVCLALPGWFSHPNPVVFIPCGFAAVTAFLLYVDLATAGGWFLSFALPVAGGIGLIVTAVAALMHYVRRGKLYIVGGAFLALGGMMLLMEALMAATFARVRFTGWSIYPLVTLALLGLLLIFLAICRPARESMERKFFI